MKRITAAALALSTLLGLLAPAAPAATQVRIATTPPGARLQINGAERENTPVTLTDLPPGRHLLVARLDGYRELRHSFSVLDGQSLNLELPLEELTGLVLVHSKPDGADVSIDGAFRGKTPLLLPNIALGTHRMQIGLTGFFPRELEVKVEDRTPQKVEVDLVADAASLSVTSDPPGAEVLVNGSNRGAAPCTLERIPTGDAEVEVRLEGYAPYREKLKLAAGQRYEVTARLSAQPGALAVVSTPEKARVYVDNQFRGETPLTIPGLPSGERRVRVEIKGFEPDARTVRVRAGETVTEEFRLESNSGVLTLVTEPPGVRVFIDGQDYGETQAAAAGMISEALRVDLLPRGEHTLQLQKAGYTHTPRKFAIDTGRVVSLHEKLTRKFIPDIEVTVRDDAGAVTVVSGVLLREHPNGDLEIETRPGVIKSITAGSIAHRRTIRATP